jgi:ABC-type nickel/cobalt efflux system permease component RcnA
MGNFSIGHYTQLRVDAGWLLIRYRLDLAEIPTVEEMRRIETDADGHITDAGKRAYLARQSASLTAGQHWTVNGRVVVPEIVATDLQERAGAGNLPTLLISIEYRIPIQPGDHRITVDYQDNNYPHRRGWREIVAQPNNSAKLIESNVPATDRSAGLDAYPADLSSPPNADSARVTFEIGGVVPAAAVQPINPTQPASGNASTPRDRFTALIATRKLSTSIICISLLFAFVLGCFHALSPGHGKTVVAAYLVGSRGTVKHAVLLGLVVTLTHVAGVFALGLIVLFASRYVIPERVYPWLGFASGLSIACVGLWQFTRRYAAFYARRSTAGHFHDGHYHVHATDGFLHDHEHDHGHHHGPGGHTHDMPDKITPLSLIALGISGGIVPCPSALVVLLASISLNRTALGLVLIVAFSLGLAAVLTAIGILMLRARRIVDRFQWKNNWLQRLPSLSSLAIAVLGIAIAVQALTAGGILQINLP